MAGDRATPTRSQMEAPVRGCWLALERVEAEAGVRTPCYRYTAGLGVVSAQPQLQVTDGTPKPLLLQAKI